MSANWSVNTDTQLQDAALRHVLRAGQAMFDNINKPRELTFYSVMDEVFGKR